MNRPAAVLAPTAPRGATATRELDEAILGELPDAHQGGVGATPVAAQLGVDRGRVERALRRMEGEGRVTHTGKRGGWARA